MSQTQEAPKRLVRLSTLVTRLICLCMLPLFFLAGYLAFDLIRAKHLDDERGTVNLAKNFAASVDGHLASRIAALGILAESPLVGNPAHLEVLYLEAQGFYRGFGAHIILANAEPPRLMLFNTRVPFGTKLPPLPTPQGHAAAPRALESGSPSVSDTFIGPVANETLVAVAVPVIRDGRAIAVYLATFETSHFQKFINEVKLAKDSSLTILDGRGDTIARQGPQADTKLGETSRVVIRSDLSPWSVVLEYPVNAINKELWGVAAVLGLGVLGAALASLLGGMLAGQRIGDAVASLAVTSNTDTGPSQIREIALVKQLLDESNQTRAAAETSLRDNERKLRLFIEHSPVALAMFNRDMHYLAVSRQFVEDYCPKKGEIVGRSHYEIFPEISERWKGLYRRGLRGETIEGNEDSFVREDGKVFWIRWAIRPWYTEGGEVGGILMFSLDISDQKHAREELREAEERLRLALDGAELGTWDWDVPTGQVVYNKGWAEMLGYDLPEIEQHVHTWETMIHPDDKVRIFEKLEAHLEGSTDSFESEYRLRHKSGNWVWVLDKGRVIERDSHGKALRVCGTHLDITASKIAEQAIRESEEKYRRIVETANEGILVIDRDQRITFINHHMADMLGYATEEITLRFVDEFMFPDDFAEHAAQIVARGQGQKGVYERRFRRKDGDERWAIVSATPLYDPDGNFAGSFGMFTDITESKRAARALEEETTRRRILFDQSPDGIVIIDPQTARFLDFNTAAHRQLGHSREEFSKLSIFDVEAQETAEETKTRIADVVHGGLADFDTLQRTRAGDTKNVHVTAQFIDIQGASVYHCIWRDITDRKRAEAEVRESEERNRRLIEASTDGIIVRSQGIITYANPAAVKLFGARSEKDLVGRLYLDLVHPDDRSESAERVRKNIEENLMAPPREHRILTLDGQVVEVESTGVPVKFRGGSQTFGIFRDITERKRAYQEKEKLEAQLQQAQKMESLGTLAGGIAHDFNNILGIIIGSSEMLEISGAVEESSRGTLASIMAASQRAKELVRQILSFSRRVTQEKVLLNLKPIIRETFEFLRASLPATIEFRQRVEPDVGAVIADPTQMQQILMNLCTNAAHAMEKTGGSLQVKLSKATLQPIDAEFDPDLEPGDYVRLTVSDTGHGIEPEIMSKIFEPYFTTKGVGKGTGLGLAVVHGIVKAHGGAIKVYSEPGKGSTFHVLLPRAQGDASFDIIEPLTLQRGSERILLVDDEAALADIEQQMLSFLGYEVEVRTNAFEALQAFRVNPGKFDLVITDLTMPQMTGTRLAREMLRIRPDIPIILCTGFSEQIGEQQAFLIGIKGFLLKPLVAAELAEAIRKVLGH